MITDVYMSIVCCNITKSIAAVENNQNHLSKLKLVTFIVFLFGFFMGIPSKHRFKPVEMGLSGIYIPLYMRLNFPVSMFFLYFLGADA